MKDRKTDEIETEAKRKALKSMRFVLRGFCEERIETINVRIDCACFDVPAHNRIRAESRAQKLAYQDILRTFCF